IDAVCSQHTPHESEFKELEFEAAVFGVSALETAYAVLNMAMGRSASPGRVVQWLAVNPRKVLGLDVPTISKGAPANITIFDPAGRWVLEKKQMRSKGKNTPFEGKELRGKVLAVINKGRFQRVTDK